MVGYGSVTIPFVWVTMKIDRYRFLNLFWPVETNFVLSRQSEMVADSVGVYEGVGGCVGGRVGGRVGGGWVCVCAMPIFRFGTWLHL